MNRSVSEENLEELKANELNQVNDGISQVIVDKHNVSEASNNEIKEQCDSQSQNNKTSKATQILPEINISSDPCTNVYEGDTIVNISESRISIKNKENINDSEDEDEINSEIDDAMDEGYMGMECTLERGFSLNESMIEKNVRNDKYEDLTTNYVQKKFPSRYTDALKHLIPIRRSHQNKDKMKVDTAGLFSFLTFRWMTGLMWKAYKTELKDDDIPLCSKYEMCSSNIQRLNLFWEEEVKKKGLENATLYTPVWKFVRTRMICSTCILVLSFMFGFVGPTIFLRLLIDWLSTEEPLEVGIIWVFCLISCEAMRILLFGLVWALNYRTAIRLRAACLGLVYKKLMNMSNLGRKSIGEVIISISVCFQIKSKITILDIINSDEVINLFANDGQRIYDFIILGTFFIGGPIVGLGSVLNILYILGPWAILGMASFLFFYPCQYILSRLSGYLRRKTVSVTDERVQLMVEIFSSIKLIKMYAWEKCFSQSITDVRRKEKKYLERAAYVHSFSIALTPVVPVLAAIITFLVHVGAGNNLTAAQGFSILALFFGEIRRSLANTNYSTFVSFQFLVTLHRLKGFSVVALLIGSMRRSLSMMNGSMVAFAEYKQTIKRMKAFSLIGVLVRLRGQLHYLPYSVLSLIDYQIALVRLKSILCMEEMEKYIEEDCNEDIVIQMKNTTLAWKSIIFPVTTKRKNDKDMKNVKIEMNKIKQNEKGELLPQDGKNQDLVEVLFGINLKVKKGELIGVCGGVGSGKSSLLQGLLGQMSLCQGRVTMKGQCAYVGQEAWILNATLRDNIILGEPFEPKRYFRVMYACSLTKDVGKLPGGENAEIGEKGINLSGGQKQRISLARALYANKDIYLLDDCLSAVDAHVGQHIFSWVIKKALKSKTVIFVTHQLQYLQGCNRIIYLHDGRIVEEGVHSELMENANIYSRLFRNHSATIKGKSLESPDDMLKLNNSFIQKISLEKNCTQSRGNDCNKATLLTEENGQQLTSSEKKLSGSIPYTIYQKYIAFCGGFLVVIPVLLTFILNAASAGFGSFWLSIWLNAGSGNTTITIGNETVVSTSIADNPDINFYKLVYGLSIILILITSLVRGFAFMKTAIKASSRIHNAAFEKVFHAPMHFFDTTPSGRIINLFSRDMDEVDIRLPMTMETFLQNIWIILIALTFVSIIFPYILVFLIFIAVLFIYIRHIFKNGIRELKRHETTSRSPIFSHLSTTVNGLSSIQAYHKQEMFMQRFMQLYDENSSAFYLFNCGTRWLAVRLDFLALSVTSATAFLSVILRSSVGPASVGLALAYASQLSGIFQYTTRLSAETEARFTSVQRLISYIETLSPKGPSIVKENQPNNGWPAYGRIFFNKVELKYRPETPLALRGITFHIDSLEKIGVVGRTGSGKSSLGVALFRLVELNDGSIFIDGINIATIGLEDLRSRLSIIPQDPVLFVGTIRYNLDPFCLHSDNEVWDALEKTRMKETISALGFKLSAPVVENGANFSKGERQLLCMARALLRKNKILFLDEATAGIDTETDSKIQDTLKEAFEDCTMITVAHRLNTIMNCSRVMVMCDGCVSEFNSPEVLLKDPSSQFFKLVASTEEGVHSL